MREVSVGDEAGQLGAHLGAGPGRCPPSVFTPSDQLTPCGNRRRWSTVL